jgi:hypothetical protein
MGSTTEGFRFLVLFLSRLRLCTVKKAYAYLAFCWVFASLRVETSILDAGIFLSSSTVFIYISNTGNLFQSVEGALFHLSE